MFWFAIDHALHQPERVLPQHIGWRVKGNFPETFKSQLEKNKNVIHRPRSVRQWEKLRPRAVLRTSGTVSPIADLPAGE